MDMLDLRDVADRQTVHGLAVVLAAEEHDSRGGEARTCLELLCVSGRIRTWAWGEDAHLAAMLLPGDEVEIRAIVSVSSPGATPRLLLTTLLHCDPGDLIGQEIHLDLPLPLAAHIQRLLAQEALIDTRAVTSPADPEEVRGLLCFLHDALPTALRTPLRPPAPLAHSAA